MPLRKLTEDDLLLDIDAFIEKLNNPNGLSFQDFPIILNKIYFEFMMRFYTYYGSFSLYGRPADYYTGEDCDDLHYNWYFMRPAWYSNYHGVIPWYDQCNILYHRFDMHSTLIDEKVTEFYNAKDTINTWHDRNELDVYKSSKLEPFSSITNPSDEIAIPYIDSSDIALNNYTRRLSPCSYVANTIFQHPTKDYINNLYRKFYLWIRDSFVAGSYALEPFVKPYTEEPFESMQELCTIAGVDGSIFEPVNMLHPRTWINILKMLKTCTCRNYAFNAPYASRYKVVSSYARLRRFHTATTYTDIEGDPCSTEFYDSFYPSTPWLRVCTMLCDFRLPHHSIAGYRQSNYDWIVSQTIQVPFWRKFIVDTSPYVCKSRVDLHTAVNSSYSNSLGHSISGNSYTEDIQNITFPGFEFHYDIPYITVSQDYSVGFRTNRYEDIYSTGKASPTGILGGPGMTYYCDIEPVLQKIRDNNGIPYEYQWKGTKEEAVRGWEEYPNSPTQV